MSLGYHSLGVMVAHDVDYGAYWKTPHLRHIERHPKAREFLQILEAGIEPQVIYFSF